MCGIAGYISKSKKTDVDDKVGQMLETIIHRGPDGCGIKVFDDRIGFGHRRLSIIDLSDAGLQPMSYGNRYWITYNGEIYNYLELKEELSLHGLKFVSDTDTEVLLAAFSFWGEECVEHFNGMWAFAIYDSYEDKIFCSRDRFGVKPFYYRLSDDKLIFTSEIKEILSLKDDKVSANRDNLIAYLVNGTLDVNEDTFFSGIKQLQGGHNLLFDCRNFEMRITRWYDLSKIPLNNLSDKDNYDRFKEEFLKSIDLRLRADVPVGSCLSGGLDSSSIVCAVNESLKKNGNSDGQYTVSSCFHDKKYDEQEYIDAVIRHTNVNSYKVFPEMDDLFGQLDEIIWHMDEPFASTSIYAQWMVFKTAKEHGLTVMLDGQGSDEQLAGYTPFYEVLFIDLLKRFKFRQLKQEVDAYIRMRAGSDNLKWWEVLGSMLMSVLVPDWIGFEINKLYIRFRKGMPFPAYFYNNKVLKDVWGDYDKRHHQKYVYAGLNNGMRSLLHYEDRDSMAFSIESRVPFLDYKLVEFIYSVPMVFKISRGRTKNILREGLKDMLPLEIYNRYSKLGFVTPEDKWLKDNESLFLEELSNACDVLSPFINKEKVLGWYKRNVQRTRRGDSTCFRIICAAHWAKVFDVMID